MIKRSDRRGEGPSYSMVLVIIAIAILLIVLFGIFGISNTAKKGLTTFGISMIDEKVTACNLHATPQLKDSFCGYRKLGDNTYMNCVYEEVKTRLIEGGLTEGEIIAMGCTQKPEEFCKSVKDKLEKDENNKLIKFSKLMTVNGKTCKSMGVTED